MITLFNVIIDIDHGSAIKVPNNKAIKYEMPLQSVMPPYLVYYNILFLTRGDIWNRASEFFIEDERLGLLKLSSSRLPSPR